MALQDVLLENVSITARTGAVIMDSHDIQLKNVEILNAHGPALHFYNAQNVAVDGFGYNEDLALALRIQSTQNENLEVSNLHPQLSADRVGFIQDAERTTLTIK
jgi:hypothetical protein